jgi:hypothetical protein
VIGAGQHEAVRAASLEFLGMAASATNRLQISIEYPLPQRGHVRFYLLTCDAIWTAEAAEEDLGYNRHELSPLFHAGHAVITAVRENSPEGG